jgi:elongation factor Ts
MAEVTASMVKELRDRTQAGMSDCKSALVEAAGDMEKAVEIILKKGIVKAAGKGGRIATEGEISTWISPDARKGVILEINTQTDFVARGDEFKRFVRYTVEVAQRAAHGADLHKIEHHETKKPIDTMRQELIAKTGENTVVRRWDAIESKSPRGYVHSYVHMGGKMGVLIEVEAPTDAARENPEFRQMADYWAMQVCSMKPAVVSRDDFAAAQIAKQKEIFEAQLKEEKKPEQAWPKIIEGKLAKWFTEVTLLGQEYVIEQGQGSVDKTRQELGKKLGGEVKIVRFVRYELGEGIEKPPPDLAAEVAKLTQ